jgi:hypothetical protein
MEQPMTSTPVGEMPAKISPTLKELVKPINAAVPHPDNIRRHNLAAIARSLQAHGQRTAIVVQNSTGFICKGNGTWAAALKMGWTELAQDWQDLDDDEALAYLFADNRASDKAEYDRDKTIKGLQKLAAGPGLFDTLWELDELEDLIAEADAVPTTPVAEFKGGYAESGEEQEARVQQASKPGQKMKEIPVVLTLADHQKFVEQIKSLQVAYGTKGVIATIVEAVTRAADGVGSKTVSSDEATRIRYDTLRALRDIFALDGRQEWKTGEILGRFQTAMGAPPPAEPAEAPLPGQTLVFDDPVEQDAVHDLI